MLGDLLVKIQKNGGKPSLINLPALICSRVQSREMTDHMPHWLPDRVPGSEPSQGPSAGRGTARGSSQASCPAHNLSPERDSEGDIQNTAWGLCFPARFYIHRK